MDKLTYDTQSFILSRADDDKDGWTMTHFCRWAIRVFPTTSSTSIGVSPSDLVDTANGDGDALNIDITI